MWIRNLPSGFEEGRHEEREEGVERERGGRAFWRRVERERKNLGTAERRILFLWFATDLHVDRRFIVSLSLSLSLSMTQSPIVRTLSPLLHCVSVSMTLSPLVHCLSRSSPELSLLLWTVSLPMTPSISPLLHSLSLWSPLSCLAHSLSMTSCPSLVHSLSCSPSLPYTICWGPSF